MIHRQRNANRMWTVERFFTKEYIAQNAVTITDANKYALVMSSPSIMSNHLLVFVLLKYAYNYNIGINKLIFNTILFLML